MNKVGLSILSGAIGLAVGAITTYIFLNKKYEEEYYWKLHEAIDEECEHLRKKHSEMLKNKSLDNDLSSEPEESKIFNCKNVEVQDPDNKISGNEYHKRLKETLENVMDKVEEELKPRFIDEDEFRFLPSKYEIRELQYLLKDGTVLDVNDEVVSDADIYISGLEEELKKMSHYATAYILVERIGVAVEITTLDVSYNDLFGE